jgi:ketosteroid isomerase-like protein
MWFRETVGYRRMGARWKVTHQHSSVPFDMVTGKPLLDLRPT